MSSNTFFHSMSVIVKRDFLAHFSNLSDNFILFLYFITGAVLWAASLGRLVSVPSYFQFLVVGLLALGVYNTSYNYMNVVSSEVRRGYMKYILALPLDRRGFTFGRVLIGAVQGIVYLGILFAFGVLFMGLPTLAGTTLILAAATALSFSLSSFGIAIATYFKAEIMDPISDISGLFLIFTSTLFYPMNLMPEWMKILTTFNILSASTNLMRSGFGLQPVNPIDGFVMGAWALLFGFLSLRGYYHRLQELG